MNKKKQKVLTGLQSQKKKKKGKCMDGELFLKWENVLISILLGDYFF